MKPELNETEWEKLMDAWSRMVVERWEKRQRK